MDTNKQENKIKYCKDDSVETMSMKWSEHIAVFGNTLLEAAQNFQTLFDIHCQEWKYSAIENFKENLSKFVRQIKLALHIDADNIMNPEQMIMNDLKIMQYMDDNYNSMKFDMTCKKTDQQLLEETMQQFNTYTKEYIKNTIFWQFYNYWKESQMCWNPKCLKRKFEPDLDTFGAEKWNDLVNNEKKYVKVTFWKCKKCRVARYCCKKCQKQGWNIYKHKFECNIIVQFR